MSNCIVCTVLCRGYGVAKGIPTLVISACAADDVVAISGFGIFLGITFNEDADTLQLALHGPIEVLIGLSFGIFWGLLAQWIPDQHHPHVSFFRSAENISNFEENKYLQFSIME